MGARLIRALGFAVFVALVCVGTAVAEGEPGETSDSARALVSQRLASAVAQLGQRLRVCDAKEEALEPGLLEDVSLSREETGTVLRYFHIKARNECLGPAAKEYLMAAYLMKESGLLDDLKASLDSKVDMASALMFPYWDELKLQAKYEALPVAKREQIEAVGALGQPFDLMATAKRWGLVGH